MALFSALLISIGFPIVALAVGSDPQGCSHEFVGCLPEMAMIVACGFLCGLIASLIALDKGHQPILTRCVLVWNVLGVLCFSVIVLKIVLR